MAQVHGPLSGSAQPSAAHNILPPLALALPSRSKDYWPKSTVDLVSFCTGFLGDACIAENFVDAIQDLADQVKREPSISAKLAVDSHWLCIALADLADALDPALALDTLLTATFDEIGRALASKVGPFAAAIITQGLKRTVIDLLAPLTTNILPGGQLVLSLRVLAILVCPDPDSCPAGERLSKPVIGVVATTEGSPVDL